MLSSKTISNNIYGMIQGKRVLGRNNKDIADAVGMAVYMFITTPNIVRCTMSGTAGPVGSIMSTITLGIVSSNMSQLMQAQAPPKKLKGKRLCDLFDGVSLGIANSLLSLTLTGTMSGLAVGVGTGAFSNAVTKTMANILKSQAVTKHMKGKHSVDLVNWIAYGFVNHIKKSAKIIVTATGAIAPVAPAGPVTVSNIPSTLTKIS